ncbi:MAG: helix-turn-helix transcriptional regulator [Methylotenera sp.]|nr:helix-turn-helix transcriptional regulator [Methylotenera sp.]
MNTMSTSLLRKVREKNNLSLEKVSLEVGISKSALSQIERGNRGITAEVAEKLVKFYGSDEINELQLLYPERFTTTTA